MLSQYKIAWQAPRFWEREYNIYGGISFLNQTVDLVWYPSDRLFSSHGVLLAGFNFETDEAGKPTGFGRLESVAAKLAASRAAVEKLHPGHGRQLTQPIYVSWPSIPYSLGSIANTHLESTQAAYNQLHQPEGCIFFAGDYLSQLTGWQEGAALSARRVVERNRRSRLAQRVSAVVCPPTLGASVSNATPPDEGLSHPLPGRLSPQRLHASALLKRIHAVSHPGKYNPEPTMAEACNFRDATSWPPPAPCRCLPPRRP